MPKSGALNLREWTAPETCGATSSATNPVDARGADWSGQDLGELDLRDAKLCRCDLRGAQTSANANSKALIYALPVMTKPPWCLRALH